MANPTHRPGWLKKCTGMSSAAQSFPAFPAIPECDCGPRRRSWIQANAYVVLKASFSTPPMRNGGNTAQTSGARGDHWGDILNIAGRERHVARFIECFFGAGVATARLDLTQYGQCRNAVRRGHPGHAQNSGGIFIRSCPIALIQMGLRAFHLQVA